MRNDFTLINNGVRYGVEKEKLIKNFKFFDDLFKSDIASTQCNEYDASSHNIPQHTFEKIILMINENSDVTMNYANLLRILNLFSSFKYTGSLGKVVVSYIRNYITEKGAISKIVRFIDNFFENDKIDESTRYSQDPMQLINIIICYTIGASRKYDGSVSTFHSVWCVCGKCGVNVHPQALLLSELFNKLDDTMKMYIVSRLYARDRSYTKCWITYLTEYASSGTFISPIDAISVKNTYLKKEKVDGKVRKLSSGRVELWIDTKHIEFPYVAQHVYVITTDLHINCSIIVECSRKHRGFGYGALITISKTEPLKQIHEGREYYVLSTSSTNLCNQCSEWTNVNNIEIECEYSIRTLFNIEDNMASAVGEIIRILIS